MAAMADAAATVGCSAWRGHILACYRLISVHARLGRSLENQAFGLGKEALTKKDVFELLESLYRDHPGPVWRVESRKAMETQDGKVACLVYGEISFIAFSRLLDHCVPLIQRSPSCKGFVFYDLGCGAGRPVFMAPLLRMDCQKACGIEIIPSMHHMNHELLMLYKTEVLPLLPESRRSQEIVFVQGDFLQEDWSDADIVFANATCFGDSLFQKLEERATRTMRHGSIVISVTKRFTGQQSWELLYEQDMKMSWSSAKVHVQRKKPFNDSTSAHSTACY